MWTHTGDYFPAGGLGCHADQTHPRLVLGEAPVIRKPGLSSRYLSEQSGRVIRSPGQDRDREGALLILMENHSYWVEFQNAWPMGHSSQASLACVRWTWSPCPLRVHSFIS